MVVRRRLAKVLGNYNRRSAAGRRTETRGSMVGRCTQCLAWFISVSRFNSTDCSRFYALESRDSGIVSEGHGNRVRVGSQWPFYCLYGFFLLNECCFKALVYIYFYYKLVLFVGSVITKIYSNNNLLWSDQFWINNLEI